MKATPKISIIVPVHNVQQYLCICVDSILNQTFSDFELLLIDDGSRDNSGKLCDEYAEKDCRVNVVHQKHQGVSAARNHGIELARGELICFIDSDDWVEKDLLNSLYIKSNSLDLTILTSVAYDFYNHTIYRTPKYSKEIYLKQEITQFLIENNFFNIGDGGCWSKLFKKSIIKKNNITFLAGNAAYEDTLFTFEYLSKCESVGIATGCRYHYVHKNLNSLSNRKHPYKNYLDSGSKGLKILSEIRQKYDVDKNSGFFITGISKFLGIYNYSIFSLYTDFKQIRKEDRITLLETLSETNRLYQKLYQPSCLKQHLVHLLIRFPNKNLSDFVFIVLFQVSRAIKSTLLNSNS